MPRGLSPLPAPPALLAHSPMRSGLGRPGAAILSAIAVEVWGHGGACGWNLEAVGVLRAQSQPTPALHIHTSPSAPNSTSPIKGVWLLHEAEGNTAPGGRHFQANAALWLLTAQIWPLLGILEFAPPSSDRAWWAWGQAWLCCTQRGKFLSPCLYGTGRRRSSWCFHCQLSFPRWPHAPHIPHLTQLRLGAAISFCLAPHARTACPSLCFANGLSHPHRTVREAVAKGRKLSLPSTGRVPGAGNPPPPPPP